MTPACFYFKDYNPWAEEDDYNAIDFNPRNHKNKNSTPVSKKKLSNKWSKSKTISQKKVLAKLVKKEPVLWDLSHKDHNNKNVLAAAWGRISEQMKDCEVEECKAIWRTLRDAVRYRLKKKIQLKSGDNVEDDDEQESDWEFKDALSFVTPMFLQYNRKTSTTFVGYEADVDTQNSIETVASCSTSAVADFSCSESNYSDVKKRPRNENDALTDSIANISESISVLVEKQQQQQQHRPPPTATPDLKYSFMWQNLERLFTKLSDEVIDDLNYQFITLTRNKISELK